MKLNCKPGDLAIKISGESWNHIPIGAIVVCRKFTSGHCATTGDSISGWDVEFRGKNLCPNGFLYFVEDNRLKPIRPTDGEDETLTWAGKPEQVAA